MLTVNVYKCGAKNSLHHKCIQAYTHIHMYAYMLEL